MIKEESEIRSMFIYWVNTFKPDPISRRILSMLVDLYIDNNHAPLWDKFNGLIKNESYELAHIFHDCMISIGIVSIRLKRERGEQ